VVALIKSKGEKLGSLIDEFEENIMELKITYSTVPTDLKSKALFLIRAICQTCKDPGFKMSLRRNFYNN